MASTTIARCRYQSMDAWRGLACLMVLVHHSTFASPSTKWYATLSSWEQMWSQVALRLWIGVPIFFVISGYCIAASADGQRARYDGPWQFFRRRFIRIYPPYWVTLFATLALMTTVDLWLWPMVTTVEFIRPWWYSAPQWLGNLSLTEMWRYHLFGGQKGMMLGHAWTLCYEEQFYAVVGLLLVVSPRFLFAGLASITALVGALGLAAPDQHRWVQGFFWDGSWLLFASGTAVYYVLAHTTNRSRLAAGVTFGAIAAWYASDLTLLMSAEKNWSQQMFVAAAFASILLLLRPADERLAASPLIRPLTLCGIMCYSLYLVHLPIDLLVRSALEAYDAPAILWKPLTTLVLSGIPSIVIAWYFHVYVERRFMVVGRTAGLDQQQARGAVLRPAPLV